MSLMGGMCVWEKYFRHEKASAKRSAIKSSSEASRVGVEWRGVGGCLRQAHPRYTKL